MERRHLAGPSAATPGNVTSAATEGSRCAADCPCLSFPRRAGGSWGEGVPLLPREPTEPRAIGATAHHWDLRDHLLLPASLGPASCPVHPNPIWGPKRSWQCGGGATRSCPAPQNPQGEAGTNSTLLLRPPPLPALHLSCRTSLGADFWEVSVNPEEQNRGQDPAQSKGENPPPRSRPRGIRTSPPHPQKARSSRVCRRTNTAAIAWQCHAGDRHDS